MHIIHDGQKVIKVFCVLGIVVSMLALFTISQHTASADVSTDHCVGSESHVHPSGGAKAICSGTISYAVNNLYEGANLFAVLLQTLVGITVTAAFLYFFWNLVKYIRDEEGKDEAKTKMGYSLGAIFVIVTLWGIIGFVRGILGIGAGEGPSNIGLPTVNWNNCTTGTYTYTVTQADASAIPNLKAGKEVTGCAANPCVDWGKTLCTDPKKCHATETTCTKGAARDYTP